MISYCFFPFMATDLPQKLAELFLRSFSHFSLSIFFLFLSLRSQSIFFIFFLSYLKVMKLREQPDDAASLAQACQQIFEVFFSPDAPETLNLPMSLVLFLYIFYLFSNICFEVGLKAVFVDYLLSDSSSNPNFFIFPLLQLPCSPFSPNFFIFYLT